MTSTLFKHEWLRTRGSLGVFFGIITLVGLLGSLLSTAGWPVLSPLGTVVGVLAAIILVPAVQILLAVDYWRSGYGRTGYFTHSIPVRGSTIFWVKLLWAALVSLFAVVVTALVAWVSWWAMSLNSEITAPSFGVLSELVSAATGLVPAWMMIAGGLMFLATVVMSLVYYFFSVSIGHEGRLSGLGAGGPIVVFVVLYICTQIASFLGMIVLPFGVGMVGDQLGLTQFNVVSEMASEVARDDVMPIGFLAAMVLIVLFCLWRTARSWNRKVALA